MRKPRRKVHSSTFTILGLYSRFRAVMAPSGKTAGSGTARMDASKAAQMEELIKKEQRCDG